MARSATSRATPPPDDPVVLIVDDDPSLRDALSSLLRSVGLRVEVFGSAPEMLEAPLPDVASCLVLDIRLPKRSGLDFQNELIKASIKIPIIFITAHGSERGGSPPVTSTKSTLALPDRAAGNAVAAPKGVAAQPSCP